MRRTRAWVWLTATLMVSACGTNGGPAAVTPNIPSTPVAVAPSVNPEAQGAVEAALKDAAAHLGTDAANLRVEQVEARQWNDSSLGCPQPGELYSQIVTPGFLIVISSTTKQLEYHSDARARVVLCKES